MKYKGVEKMVELNIDEISDIEECKYALEHTNLVKLNDDMLEKRLEKIIPNNVLDRWDIRLLSNRSKDAILLFSKIIDKYYKGKENEIKHKAQEKYCEENNYPHFAPKDTCFRCYNHIYEHISLRKASNELITGCPCCSYSYCD